MTERIYDDEAIPLPTGRFRARAESEPRPDSPYVRMLEVADEAAKDRCSPTEVFYRQAKVMADFRETTRTTAGFLSYFPKYADMSLRQMKAYFFWRTQVRDGIVETAPVSFAFVYIYELLHGIGAKTPAACLIKLRDFRRDWLPIDRTVERYIGDWLNDFVAFWGLPESELSASFASEAHRVLAEMLNTEACRTDPDRLYRQLCEKVPKSAYSAAFWTEHEDLCRHLTTIAWTHLVETLPKEVLEAWFGQWEPTHRAPFTHAVFFEGVKGPDHVTELSDERRVTVKDGYWSEEAFVFARGNRPALTALFKAVQTEAKRLEGARVGKAVAVLPAEVTAAAQWAADLIRRERRAAVNPAASIDLTRLAGIRADALETQTKLTVEGAEDEAVSAFDTGTAGAFGKFRQFGAFGEVGGFGVSDAFGELPAEQVKGESDSKAAEPAPVTAGVGANDRPADMPLSTHVERAPHPLSKTEVDAQPLSEPETPAVMTDASEGLLTAAEKAFLAALLDGDCKPELIGEAVPLTMIVDRLNEKLYDEVGDAVLELTGSGAAVIEDYLDDVRDLLEN